MTLVPRITHGLAILKPEGLRCQASRASAPSVACNKLICRTNNHGQIAGSFLCERCRQNIEVSLVEAPTA